LNVAGISIGANALRYARCGSSGAENPDSGYRELLATLAFSTRVKTARDILFRSRENRSISNWQGRIFNSSIECYIRWLIPKKPFDFLKIIDTCSRGSYKKVWLIFSIK
jgi:hypothetical protein